MRAWVPTAGLMALAACGGRDAEPPSTEPREAGVGADAAITPSSDAAMDSSAAPDSSNDARSLGGSDGGCAGTEQNGYCTLTLATVPPDAVTTVHGPGAVAVDARDVYWISSQPPGCSCNGSYDSVMSVPIGGGPVSTLASGYYEPGYEDFPIALDDANVYWTGGDPHGSSAAVWRMPLGGGAATPLAASTNRYTVSDVAVDSTSAYWSTMDGQGDSMLMKAPLAGGAPTALAVSSCLYGPLAVDGASVYWFDCHSLLATPVGGGTTSTLAASVGNDLAVDPSSVIWDVDDASGNGLVMRIPIGGGAPVTVAAAPGQAGSLAIDVASVYWIAASPMASTVMKAPLAGGAAIPIGEIDSVYVSGGIAVDASGSVYWTVGDALMKTYRN